VLLDVDVEAGLRRKQRGNDWNRLDAYALEFHRRVRAGYFELANLEPARWVTVDANRGPEDVQVELRRVLTERLALS
jgi:dTMP kinase